MPVIVDINIGLNAEEAVTIPGLRCRGLMQKRILSLLPGIFDEIKQSSLVRPAIAWEIVEVETIKDGVMKLHDGSRLQAPLLSHRMRRASRLAFIVATLGEGIGRHINGLFNSGQQLKAILTEEIANAWLFRVSQLSQEWVDKEAAKTGLQASGSLSPGDEGFPLQGQAQVLEQSGAARLGIALSEYSMMTPRHSLSSVIGLGRRMQRWTQVENCAECRARDRCPHRHTLALPA